MVGQRLQVVELAPGQNALAVGLRGRQTRGAGAGGDQHHVGVVGAGAAVRAVALTQWDARPGLRSTSSTSAGDHLDARVEQLGVDVGGLGGGQRLDPLVDFRQRDLGVVDVDVEAQLRCPAQFGAHAGGGDERLRRHAVEEHRRAADAVRVDDGDLGVARCRDECRLVTGRPSPDDHDAARHSP